MSHHWPPRRAPTLLLLALLLFAFSPASADVQYQYDALGRLVRVMDETGQVATYEYDAVGNILRITRSTVNQVPPQLDAITPTQADTGATVPITITGQNLLFTQSVTTDNPGIAVGSMSPTNEQIATTFTIIPAARLGATTVTVTNPFGSATVGFTVLQGALHFDVIIAAAQFGNPADGTQPSANVGQTITILGRNLTNLVQFETPQLVSGVLQATPVTYPLTNVNFQGTEAQVTIGTSSGTGLTRLQNAAGPSPESRLLQIVATLTRASVGSFFAGATMTLDGTGFTGDMKVRFPLATSGTMDQPIVAGSVNEDNTSAQVVIPDGAVLGLITVVTPGGESNAVVPEVSGGGGD